MGCGVALSARCSSCGHANPVGAKFCLECGQKLVASEAETASRSSGFSASGLPTQAASAERRHLTVMFCDLVGSTALSARLDPEDMREIVGAYLRCCADLITKAGGFVAKYMGDGVLAYFGYPQAHEDDAERAVRGALSLVEAVPMLRTGHEATLHVRVGIATGLVVVGDLIGEGDAQERGVVGDTPNLAARLQTLAQPGQVVISQGTRRLTGGLFAYRDLGRVALKGLADPVQAWQVTGATAVQSRFEAQHETSLTPLVGRQEELELLLRRWREAESGEGRVVLLSGEPGIGKSRLTVALQERVHEEPHTRLRYFCSPQHTDSALYPIISQLERAAEFERHDTPDAKLDKLIALLGPSAGHERDIQLLAELLSIPTGDRCAPLDWSAQRKKDETFRALLRQLEMLSRQRPVLMIYEDAHWIDPSTRELLDTTVERVARLPVLLVITFRPEFHPPWIGQAHVSTLGLNRLGRREGAGLAERVAGNNVLPDEIMAEIVERGDGVPLFVEELTKAVVDAGVDGDAARRTVSTAPHPALSVPATLHASLMARLDRLGPVAKEIAQIGAAIGREFSYELLAPVAQKSDADLQAALGRLSEAGLVFCRGTPPQATFLFKHALVRDAAYGSLLRGQRQQLNARIVALLEEQFEETRTNQPELLAQHCVEADLNQKAVNYWLMAGQLSLTRSALVEAVAQLRKGLALVANLPEGVTRVQHELDLRIALGKAMIATKGYAASETGEAFNRARSLCDQLDRPPQLVSVLHGQWVHVLLAGDLALARSRAEELLTLGMERDDPVWTVMGCRISGVTCCWLGEWIAARDYLERGLLLYDPAHRSSYAELTVDDTHVVLLTYLAWALLCLGYLDQARAKREAALAEARLLSRAFTLAHALSRATHAEAIVVGPSGAVLYADEWVSLTERQSIGFYGAEATIFQGWCVTMLGQGEKGIAQLTRGLAAYRAQGLLHIPTYLTLLADAYRKVQQPQNGLRQLVEAIGATDTTQGRYYEAEMHRVRGELFLSMHDDGASEASFRTAINVAQHQSAKTWELRASTSLARLWRDQGKRTEAHDLLAPIYGWFTEGFDTPDLKEAKALLDELA
jgi:class 3 adenylate cyclase/tetratricopeptide (TPR) repeat protein